MPDPDSNSIPLTSTSVSLWAEVLVSDALALIVQNLNQQAADTFELEVSAAGLVSAASDGSGSLAIVLDLGGGNFDFGLNEIPQATLSVTVGRNTQSGLAAAALHFLSEQFRLQTPVKVYLQAQELWGPTFMAWPSGPVLLFDGVAVSSGFQTAPGMADFKLHLAHWAINLANSSMLSRLTTPANPLSGAFDATIAMLRGTGAGAETPFVFAANMITSSDCVRKDLWGQQPGGLRDFLNQIAGSDFFDWRQLNALLAADGQVSRQGNAGALAALARFEPYIVNGVSTYTYGVPLTIDPAVYSGTVPGRVAAQWGEVVSKMARASFWDKLVGELAPNFQFAVVPMINRVLCVPFCPAISSQQGVNQQQIIYSSEIESFNMSVGMPRPVRGVCLYTGRTSLTGARNPANQTQAGQPFSAPGAVYDSGKDGVFLFDSGAPGWISNTLPPSAYVGFTAASPAVNQNPAPGGAGAAPVDFQTGDQKLWSGYAQYLYAQERLRHRQCSLSGPLRLDVGPGSLLAIEIPRDKFVAVQTKQMDALTGDYLYGVVLRVSVSINAESPSASTAFHVGYVKNGPEDVSSDTSLPRHPIWSTPWYGCPLADGF